MIFAESGKFTFDGDGQPDGFDDSGDAKPTAHVWSMDLLGNWSRPVNDYGYHTFQDNNGNGEFDLADDVTLSGQLHNTNAANEIVSVVTEAGPTPTPFVYDAAGNLIDNGVRTFKFDAWNRVVEVKASADLIAEYEYDALCRRIRKRVENSGAPFDTTGDGDYFYYDGHRMLEHRTTNASNTAVEPHRRYVYGLDYIDEVVAYYDTGAADPDPHFVLQDANYDVVGVTDHTGILEQQYSYAPYGAYQHIEDGSGNAEGNGPADLTELLIPLGRNGLILDRETGLYYNRARYYDPLLSRFLQADPNGTGMVLVNAMMKNASSPGVGSQFSVGGQYSDGMSLYELARSNALGWIDPMGQQSLRSWFRGDMPDWVTPDYSFEDLIRWYLEAHGGANADPRGCLRKVYKALGSDYDKKTGQPGTVGGEKVAWSYIHCVNHCALTRNSHICGGPSASMKIGELTEAVQKFICLGGNAGGGLVKRLAGRANKKWADKIESECQSAYQRSDYFDNALGRKCGATDEKCSSCCEKKMRGKTRDKLPEGPGTSRPFGPHHPRRPGPDWPEDDPLLPDNWGLRACVCPAASSVKEKSGLCGLGSVDHVRTSRGRARTRGRRSATMVRTISTAVFAVAGACSCWAQGNSGIATRPPPHIRAPEMVLVKGGTFLMGSPIDDRSSYEYHECERPQQEVRVGGFYLARFVVTAEEFCRFLNERGEDGLVCVEYAGRPTTIEVKDGTYRPRRWAERCPATRVTWKGAVGYSAWLSKKTGHSYRLPTETEWEYAARGTELRPWPWGTEAPDDHNLDPKANPFFEHYGARWIYHPWAPDQPVLRSPVGSFPRGATPDGILDMLGYSFGEWCADEYAESSGGRSAAEDVRRRRVVRGVYHKATNVTVGDVLEEKKKAKTIFGVMGEPSMPQYHPGRSWTRMGVDEQTGVGLIRLATDGKADGRE